MLACLQRRESQPPQHPVCVGKILDTPIIQKSDLSSMRSTRYPSAAELDAYAQKMADSPLSIKIFPSNIRVPQHKQVSRTVNGLDTTAPRFSPYGQPYSSGYQGLLAIAKAPTAAKGVVKGSDGKRTRLSPIQMAVAPYAPPSHGGLAGRHRHRPCSVELCKPPAAPSVPAHPGVMAVASAACLSGGRSLALAPHSDHAAHSMARQMARASHGQGLHVPGEAHSSPSRQAATAAVCSDSFGLVGPAHSSLAYSGAVLPAQPADMAKAAGYIDSMDYGLWQPKHQRHPQQQKQHYQQGGSMRVYGTSGGGRAAVSASPDVCLPAGTTQLTYRGHALSGGTGAVLDKLSPSPLNCVAPHGELPVGHFFPPPWNSVLATPDGDCYNPQELPLGSVGLGSAHGHTHTRQGHTHAAPPPYVGQCCGLPGRGLCQASLLSSSLQSLECLISEIHPPCIKERMLGRGYDMTAVPRPLEHQPLHIQLPVFR